MSLQMPNVRHRELGRRERVIEGAVTAITVHGVERLTHRRVAEAAGVSLSATTYYFATLEEVLEAAFAVAVARDIATAREHFADIAPADGKAALLAYIDAATSGDRAGAAIITELHGAATRRPSLRELVLAWEQAWAELLEPALGPAAPGVGAAVAGHLMRALVVGDAASPDALGKLLDRLPEARPARGSLAA